MSAGTGKTIKNIIAALGEADPKAQRTISRVVWVKGTEHASAWLAEALEIEAGTGMLTDDGQRRTVGGIFFKLVKNGSTARERGRMFGPPPHQVRKGRLQPLPEAERIELTRVSLSLPAGEVKSMKLTLIGRPGRVLEKGVVAITTMTGGQAPALPKGLPQPPSAAVTYVVYMAAKQWSKVKAAIEGNPAESLIVEGYPVFERRLGPEGTMTLYARKVMLKPGPKRG
jgi:hypothetical protein